MQQYVDLLQKILTTGEDRQDRTGVGIRSIFGGQIEFDLRESFPLVTIKKTLYDKAFIEMLWFLRGESNTKFLKDHNVSIWDDWADKEGNLGPIYGVQWRKWRNRIDDWNAPLVVDSAEEGKLPGTFYCEGPPIDQVKNLIESVKTNPTSRRHIVTAWNPAYIDVMGLPPCHRDFQCYVSNDGYLDLMMAIRSWDTALGAPFNIAQYALLTHLLAQCTNLKPRFLKINYGDAHLYSNHIKPIHQMLSERSIIHCKPKLIIHNSTIDIDSFKPDDFEIVGYEHHSHIKLPIAV